MRVLVFGKNGQVAQSLRNVAGESGKFDFLGREDVDLLKPGAGADAISDLQPDTVINAAAYTNVDRAESEEESAHRLNAEAPAEIAVACGKSGAQFIHLSTDYVFDGVSDSRPNESATPNPLSAYGQTKLRGEKAVLAALPGAIIVRTSWIFSEYGTNFVKTMLRLASERAEISIVSDQIGGPTDALDIANAIKTIAAKKLRGAPGEGLYHFQGAPSASWAAFAEKIFELATKAVIVKPIPTSEYPTPARRPLQTVLDCARLERDFGIGQPDWRIGLRRVIATLQK